MDSKEYFAFISYQRKDEEWAKWLAHELEHYRFPVTLNGRKDLPKELRPIFRDIDELSAGNLPNQIHKALEDSKYLIVVCSPNSAKSEWVNKEIEEFISMGKIDKIFPFIVEGKAFSEDSNEECFPPALRNLPKEDERLGGNINEMGRDAAVVKTVAGMLGLAFDTLWQRYEREKAEEERKIREQRDCLLRIQSRFLSEKVIDLVNEGDTYLAKLLALNILPKDLCTPDIPYTAEAEKALRYADEYESFILKGHLDTVLYTVYSPNGQLIGSASRDETVRIWDAKTGKCLYVLNGHEDEITSITFASDNVLVSFSKGGKARIWNLTHGKCIQILSCSKISFSDDKKLFITASDNFIQVWDSVNGICIKQIEVDGVKHACFSSSGNYIASVDYSNAYNHLCIWNYESGEKYRYCYLEPLDDFEKGEWNTVFNIVFSKDETKCFIDWWVKADVYDITDNFVRPLILDDSDVVSYKLCEQVLIAISSNSQNLLWIIDLNDLEKIYSLSGHQGKITAYCVSPDGNYIATASEDKSLRIWRISDGTCCKIIDIDNVASIILFHPDGKNVITASNFWSEDHSIKKWNIESGICTNLAIPKEDVNSLIYNPKGDVLLSASGWEAKGYDIAEKYIKRIKLNSGNIKFSTVYQNKNAYAIFSVDNQYFAEAIGTTNEIRIWSVELGQCIKTFQGHSDRITCLLFHPNEECIISASEDGTIRIWNIDSEECLLLIDNYYSISCVDLSPDGQSIVSSSADCAIKIWDIRNGQCVKTFKGQNRWYNSLFFSPNGNLLMVAQEDIRIWDINSERCIMTINDCEYAKYNDDGSQIVSSSCDKSIKIWDSKTGTCVKVFKKNYDKVRSISYSFDQRYILSSHYGIIKVWDCNNGYCIKTYKTDCDCLASFSSNNNSIISSSSTYVEIREWIPLQELLNKVRKQFENRDLTEEEKVEWYLKETT